jgi:hypothetical protein
MAIRVACICKRGYRGPRYTSNPLLFVSLPHYSRSLTTSAGKKYINGELISRTYRAYLSFVAHTGISRPKIVISLPIIMTYTFDSEGTCLAADGGLYLSSTSQRILTLLFTVY